MLVAAVIVALVLLNILLQYIGWPGVNGGMAGGMGGAVIAVFMSRPPFVVIEQVGAKKKKKKRN